MTSRNQASTHQSPYAMGYSEEFLSLLERRSAETVAFHLLPHLRSGMKVLDFGCGPGTISVGLAKAVAPGELQGVDIEASQIAMAQAAAQAGGHDNAHFQVGDVTNLPFADNTFDVAHCHAVLMHVPNLAQALAEVQRVLKPGGILSARESVIEANIFEPDPQGCLAQATVTFSQLLTASGGRPNLGKALKSVLLKAGFRDVRATASFEPFSEEADRVFLQGFIRNWFFSPKMKAPAIKYGLATEEDFAAWGEALDTWRAHPGGFAAFSWGEAIAHKA
ncbi:MAG: class I SAM-dependent methyltransferase [Synechococcus sp. SB0666_bin_14]|nr:class I SAM-dependent methyltransferase [Synechococcus sp. SB0666_bin_14]MYA91292.1 class I SAM-dependent methyltransferase [Synechococcus sp. SB0663_bin_10]MYG46642.1 class I SAM-dependent methyltransferase [Synechococcus sp. SB0675_bin_6]MYJ59750.1 class I SAM-dependent methyltransferase [Synechococcus sp. SB0672_bin_6]MYK91023.1 class I SAM-dependent methyltransferase [Synechococcus sp. SB0669_bin_8]